MAAPTASSILRDPRYRGMVADIAVFVASLIAFYLLGKLTREFVLLAETNSSAKLGIGCFFLTVLLLQPWGPLLKRRPFHARHPDFGSSKESLAGCWVAAIAFFYLIALMLIAGAASSMITEVVLADRPSAETVGVVGFLVGLGWAIGSAVVFVRFFLPPKTPARSEVDQARSEGIADLILLVNLILLQIVWGSVMASNLFWEVVIKTPLGRPNSWTAILGRFIVLAVVAMMVYLPPRIFFLVEQRRRRMALLTMLLANLPIILKALLATSK